MQWAVAEKLIQGIDTVDGVCLVPRGNATRAQVCAILHRFDLLSKCVDGAEHQIAVDAAVEPTCTEDGLTEGSRCTVCNEVFTEQTVIPATGHTETTVPATEPTCTENGNTEYTVCQVCNETLTEGQVIEATGHSFGEFTVTKEPTYTEEGEQVKICTVCEFAQTEAIGMLVPENGLVYETEEYTYTYYVDHATGAADGWNAIVNDNTKTSYTKPESYIYGKPVTQLYKTYSGCKSLIAPPAIPETVSVLYNTYKNCTALTVAPEIPDTVNNMTFAFWGCSSLVTPPSLPAGVNLKGTFRNCSLLAYAPDVSKATDMEETFFGCTSLAGDAVLACDSNAKAYADTGISRVIIKPSVTKISSGAFDGCSKLVKVIYEGDTESYAALEIEGYNAAFNEAVFEFSTPQPLTVVQKNGNIHVIGLSSDINDLFVSEGTWDSYRDAADNRIARITSEDVNQSQVYVYKPGSPLAAGSYTVYVRYQDEAKAHSYFSFTVE